MKKIRPPLVGADIWLPVIEAAGLRCQCTGQCGHRHSQSKGRCPHEQHGTMASKRGRINLIAAPASDLLRFPARGPLQAWCPTCWDDVRRREARERKAAPEITIPLFDLAGGAP